MKHPKTLLALALLDSATVTGTAQASLFDRGNGLIYDNATNITWAKDANLFQTQAAGNANLVADIIAANNGVIHDIPNSFDNGIYTLTSTDFTASSGTLDWWGAQAWIGYLNKASYDGYNNWALPTASLNISGFGFNQTGSQMGELFYNELGGVAFSSISTTHNVNYNLFTNVQISPYWSDSNSPDGAWSFFFGTGYEFPFNYKNGQYYAWAVRPGDVSSVPLPAAFWLFGSGLMGLLGFKRRGNIG
jgi:hypothetical protein